MDIKNININNTEEELTYTKKFAKSFLEKNGNFVVSKDEKKILENLKNTKDKPRKYKKGFEGGASQPLRGNWETGTSTADVDIYRNQSKLVNISRNLAGNNGIYQKYLSLFESNVVGKGFTFISEAKDYVKGKQVPDILGNSIIKESFLKWGKAKFCDITGRNSFREQQRLIARTLAQDGEILVRHIRSKPSKDNPWGYSLQQLDPQRLDLKKNENLSNGNIIVMGVEMNSYGKPVAYWIKLPNARDMSVYGGSYSTTVSERVPAEQVLHRFRADSPKQTRGVPYGHSIFSYLTDLDEFLRVALIASKVGAASSMYLTRTSEAANTPIDALADRRVGENGEVTDEEDPLASLDWMVSPGQIRALPVGVDIKTFDGKYPSDNFVNYLTFMLKLVASGLNVSFFTLANSYESVNYTSSRTGLLEERDQYVKEQDWMIEAIMNDIYEIWLEQSFLNGAIKFPNGSSLPVSKLDKFMNYAWKGRRWPWVDPQRDALSKVLEINNGLTTLTQVLSEQGLDYEDVLRNQVREEELRKIYGVTLDRSKTEIQYIVGESENSDENKTEVAIK